MKCLVNRETRLRIKCSPPPPRASKTIRYFEVLVEAIFWVPKLHLGWNWSISRWLQLWTIYERLKSNFPQWSRETPIGFQNNMPHGHLNLNQWVSDSVKIHWISVNIAPLKKFSGAVLTENQWIFTESQIHWFRFRIGSFLNKMYFLRFQAWIKKLCVYRATYSKKIHPKKIVLLFSWKN